MLKDEIEIIFIKNKIKDATLLIAYSGGKDSACLLNVISKLKKSYNLIIHVAYVNHNLRDDESDKEEIFIKEQVSRYHAFLHILRINKNYWINHKNRSIEQKARKIRYNYFKRLKIKHKIDFILTAHHFDDRIETTLINLLKGSSDESLVGIPFKRGIIFRPMLNITNAMIKEYIINNNISYFDDSSNSKNIYFRNKIRNILIKDMESIIPHFRSSFKSFYKMIELREEFIKKYLIRIIRTIKISNENNNYIVNKKKFKLLDKYIRTRIIKIIVKKISGKTFYTKGLFDAVVSENKINYANKFISIKESGKTIIIKSNIKPKSNR